MNLLYYIIIGSSGLLIGYVFITYNKFISLNNMTKEAFATMDVYLKKRWDLIPNLVETVKGYAKHERDTLESVIQLRNSSYDKMSLNDKIDMSEKLTSEISKLMMLIENYPDLKASRNFSDLSGQLSKLEDEIANSRKYYNAVVKNMNNKIEMFPSNILAKLFGYKSIKMYEANVNERGNVEVKF